MNELTGEAQRLAARGEYPNLRGVGEDCLAESRAGGEQMLAVVEDDQELLGAQVIHQCVQHRAMLFFLQLQTGHDGGAGPGFRLARSRGSRAGRRLGTRSRARVRFRERVESCRYPRAR